MLLIPLYTHRRINSRDRGDGQPPSASGTRTGIGFCTRSRMIAWPSSTGIDCKHKKLNQSVSITPMRILLTCPNGSYNQAFLHTDSQRTHGLSASTLQPPLTTFATTPASTTVSPPQIIHMPRQHNTALRGASIFPSTFISPPESYHVSDHKPQISHCGCEEPMNC